MAHHSDAELWQIAGNTMNEEQQTQLESLAGLQKSRSLTKSEAIKLQGLMEAARHTMLRKAEAYRLLARRGYKVFQAGTLSD